MIWIHQESTFFETLCIYLLNLDFDMDLMKFLGDLDLIIMQILIFNIIGLVWFVLLSVIKNDQIFLCRFLFQYRSLDFFGFSSSEYNSELIN